VLSYCVSTFYVPCCDVRYDYRMEEMFSSSLPLQLFVGGGKNYIVRCLVCKDNSLLGIEVRVWRYQRGNQMYNKRQRIQKGQSQMDNPEKLAIKELGIDNSLGSPTYTLTRRRHVRKRTLVCLFCVPLDQPKMIFRRSTECPQLTWYRGKSLKIPKG
jgi:hypothetical protein